MTLRAWPSALLWGGLVVALLVGVLAVVIWPVVNRVSEDLPPGFPEDGFSHASFERVLERYVTVDGQMNYESLSENDSDRLALRQYLEAVARFSPDNAPERFAQEGDRTAYWLYAYNALVIHAVLERWPLSSVTDVKAPIEVVRGLGFFYKLKFVCGGEVLSLYEIEHKKVLERAKDPRVHFVLNCGSGGCPIIRPKLPTGDNLEPFLAEAAAQFVSSEKNVQIDHGKKVISVSKIFEWYEKDFLDELRRRGLPATAGVYSYLLLVAPQSLRSELTKAAGYRVMYEDYDWTVNSGEDTGHGQ